MIGLSFALLVEDEVNVVGESWLVVGRMPFRIGSKFDSKNSFKFAGLPPYGGGDMDRLRCPLCRSSLNRPRFLVGSSSLDKAKFAKRVACSFGDDEVGKISAVLSPSISASPRILKVSARRSKSRISC